MICRPRASVASVTKMAVASVGAFASWREKISA
jgi:hypothetical protein